MPVSARFLNPSEADRRLGVSIKALRLYEQRGLVLPLRSAAGWRAYGPEEMARAAEIVALRKLGLSLVKIRRVLADEAADMAAALAQHQAMVEAESRRLAGRLAQLRGLRAELAEGRMPASGALARLVQPVADAPVRLAVDLPWPWGGERFELRDIRALNYIIGPLGSGKTRLARLLAQTLPDAAFLGLERLVDGAAALARLQDDPLLRARVERALAALLADGATWSEALMALVAGLEAEGPAMLVIDMVEQGLDQASQMALIAYLRRRLPGSRPLFLLTRSSAILDLGAMGDDEAIILCPANHSPPSHVAPYPGAPGYEAVVTCLATPAVRARSEGLVASFPGHAAPPGFSLSPPAVAPG